MKLHKCTQLHMITKMKKAKNQYTIEKNFIVGQKILVYSIRGEKLEGYCTGEEPRCLYGNDYLANLAHTQYPLGKGFSLRQTTDLPSLQGQSPHTPYIDVGRFPFLHVPELV